MIRITFTRYVILGHELNKRTVVNTFRDRLENLDIERSSTAVVPIVFVFIISDDTACPLRGRESNSGRLGYPGNDLTSVEGENGRVRIHSVLVEYFRKVRRLEDRFREVLSERVFIRTTSKINRTLAPTVMLRKPKKILTWYISAPLLEERGSAGGTQRTNKVHDGTLSGRSSIHTKRTVESLCLGKEPIKPTPVEIQRSKLLESPLLVHPWVVSELSAFDETEDDCILEPSQDRTDSIEGEGISGGRIIGLHGWLPGGEGERTVGGDFVLELILIFIPITFRSALDDDLSIHRSVTCVSQTQ